MAPKLVVMKEVPKELEMGVALEWMWELRLG